MATRQVPTVVPERHLYKVEDAAALLSVSRSVVYELIRAGQLRSVVIGRSRRVPAKAINDFITQLIAESGACYDQAS
ncbi:helix-turn-helix domain-containing protein [Actinokineospora sp.]|uniref:helix-turn-helix domain-containing protein n=1 Tax=Actinokineospora sp. TaxID=1872133 RepID=UPI003D6BAF0F